MLVLASTGAARRAMLEAAGIVFECEAPRVDEQAAKVGLTAAGFGASALADALAELKAVKVSLTRPGDLVLGCDQTLELEDGTLLDKPGLAVGAHLRHLSGKTHRLHAAAVAAENGVPIWRHTDSAKLGVRSLSDAFISDYAASEGAAAGHCLEGYRIEGLGVQLFDTIEGSHFAILGLPLLPLLRWLRQRGLLSS